MFRKFFIQGIVAGVLSAVAAIIYDHIYYFATMVDYSDVLNWGTLTAANITAGILIATLYWILNKWLKEKGEVIFNFALSIFSFAVVIVPISISLPLTVLYPELFPGLAVPMVFFPAMSWFTINPLFRK